MMKPGWVYIMTNAPHGTLYTGVTADLPVRISQHRTGSGSDFCKKWNLTRLVYIEPYPRIDEAITREKAMKRWKRSWKVELICKANPDWRDLFKDINA